MHPDDTFGLEDRVYRAEFDLLRHAAAWPLAFIGTTITEDDFTIAEHKAVINIIRAVGELQRDDTRVDRLTIVRGVKAEFAHHRLAWDDRQSRLEWRTGDEIRKAQHGLTAAGSPAPSVDIEQPVGHGMTWGPGPILFLTAKTGLNEFDSVAIRRAQRVMCATQQLLEDSK